MAHTATLTHSGLSLGERFANLVARIKEANALRAQYSHTYAELQSLNDRELNDIGVRRCDIADIARVHVYGS